MRYGFTTHALIARTIATAPMIVTAQSIVTRSERGRPGRSADDRVARVPRALLALTLEPLLRRLGLPEVAGPAVGVAVTGRPAEERVLVLPADGLEVGRRPLLGQAALRARLSARRHSSIRAWLPESSTSGTCQPRNSAGLVYCGYSSPPSSSAENVSMRPDSLVAERAGQEPRDGVDDHHRRQLAAGEDVRADGDRVRAQVLDDALVEALETRREQRQRAPPPRAPRRRPGRDASPAASAPRRDGSGASP